RREQQRPDPVSADELAEPPGTAHRHVSTDDGGSIHVLERGTGRPVLLVHGVTLAAAIWHYQLVDLASDHRVLAIDHRGHGESKAGSDPHGLERLARDLHSVITDLDLRDVIVVGHSMGGMAALRYAVDFPDELRHRVSGLVLVSTTGGPVNPMAAWQGAIRAVAPFAARGLRAGSRVPGGLMPANDLGYVLARWGFGEKPSPSHVELTRAMNAATMSETLPDLVDALIEYDLSGFLAEIDLPTLVVVGSKDRLTPPFHARRLAKALPNARLEVLPGCGHMPMLERRVELDRLVRDLAAGPAKARG
ncbi:MAG TPA: alpha/beta hydrolase, partial [Acidimicrobiales bacterium]|nr:alpha/beta hydrolase [Acidimicrobiales bacterium]